MRRLRLYLYITSFLLLAGCGRAREHEGEVIYNARETHPPANGIQTPAPTPYASPDPTDPPALIDPSPTPSPTDSNEPVDTPPPLVSPSPPPSDGGSAVPHPDTPQTWNISPRTGGIPPIGSQTGGYLRPFSSFYRGGETAHIYLTFELSYEAGYTEGVLDVLSERNVVAAFFLTLPYIENNGDLVLRMIAEGHVVGILSHQVMTDIGADEISEMILLTSRYFSEHFGRPIDPFLRPLGGAFSEHTLVLTRHYGFFTVFWSAERHDDFHPGMILSHKAFDPQSVNTVSQIIDDMASAGFVFVSLYQLI